MGNSVELRATRSRFSCSSCGCVIDLSGLPKEEVVSFLRQFNSKLRPEPGLWIQAEGCPKCRERALLLEADYCVNAVFDLPEIRDPIDSFALL